MNDWLLSFDGYDEGAEGLREALCTLGNGYMGTRGATPESHADGAHYPGTYIAGCYDRLRSDVAGRIVESEDLVNAPNWLPVTFRIDGGEWFDPREVTLLEYQQQLDMRRGVLVRLISFRDRQGRRTNVTQRRMVSMDTPHVACLETTIAADGWTGRLEVRCALDGTVTNSGVPRYRNLNGDHLVPVADGHDEANIIWLQMETVTSRLRIAEAARLTVTGAVGEVSRSFHRRDGWVALDLGIEIGADPVVVEKVVTVYTSRDPAIYESLDAARIHVSRADGFDVLLHKHVIAWKRLWRIANFTIDGKPDKALNLNIFHVLQVLSEHIVDLDVGMPARGLHGEAYRGHVFWDEVFTFPFLNMHFPEVARALLMYRYRRLPEARWAAHEEGFRGAMFPWQSGSDGRDETPRVHLNPNSGRWLPDNSHLQRHVGIAIGYNVWQHYQVTGDLEFMVLYGAEMLLEVSRFFNSITTYNRILDRYEILGVMGPDEYHDSYPDSEAAGLNNTSYVNVMTVWLFRRTLDTLALLGDQQAQELKQRLGVRVEELERIEDICRKMRVVFHDGVIAQFEGYETLKELDWEAYRAKYGNIRRMDRILEAEGDSTNAYQVSKQAAVTMLFFLLSRDELRSILSELDYDCSDECFDRTIDYYLARTSHGSSLSSVVHAWVLARRDSAASWQFFREALSSDLEDIQGGTTQEGIHLGAIAGTIDLVQRGFTGIELRGGKLHVTPRLPEEVGELAMNLQYRGHRAIRLTCHKDRTELRALPSHHPPVDIVVDDEPYSLEAGGTVAVPRPQEVTGYGAAEATAPEAGEPPTATA